MRIWIRVGKENKSAILALVIFLCERKEGDWG